MSEDTHYVVTYIRFRKALLANLYFSMMDIVHLFTYRKARFSFTGNKHPLLTHVFNIRHTILHRWVLH